MVFKPTYKKIMLLFIVLMVSFCSGCGYIKRYFLRDPIRFDMGYSYNAPYMILEPGNKDMPDGVLQNKNNFHPKI